MAVPILHTAADWIAIDKPTGMAVHRSRMSNQGPFVVDALKQQLGRKPYTLHRLDRPTSGVLLIGLSPQSAAMLQTALTDPKTDKSYLALVRGAWQFGDGWKVIDRPIKDDNGIMRDCHTQARALAASRSPRCTLVEARIRTGRFHQVRRHLQGLGYPVIGDSTHGDTRCNRAWRNDHGSTRLALHCWRIDLELPQGSLRITAPPPQDLVAVWRQLPWWNEVAAELGVVMGER